MPALELKPEEQKILLEILERADYNLRVEIANTDQREFRRELKQREVVMETLIDRLKKTAG
jgi:TRAP-type C4-dicarboxylate transport system substrate-binding protein